MSERGPSASARVVKVAAGLERTVQTVPVRDRRHEALGILIGRWINEGHATPEVPSVPILTSDGYEWAPGGFFVVHSAYGRIGERRWGGNHRSDRRLVTHPRSTTASAMSTPRWWRSTAT